MSLAADAPAWTGAAAGLVALVAFVLFSTWVIVQRVRGSRKDRHG